MFLINFINILKQIDFYNIIKTYLNFIKSEINELKLRSKMITKMFFFQPTVIFYPLKLIVFLAFFGRKPVVLYIKTFFIYVLIFRHKKFNIFV